MSPLAIRSQTARFFWVVCLLTIAANPASAQLGGGGGIGGGGNNNNNNQGGAVGGVSITADGLLSVVVPPAENPRLKQRRLEALASQHLATDVMQSSDFRKVSLVKLEQECLRWADSGQQLPAEIEFLAGLQRIDYVFVDEAGRDIVLAGPAGGFAPDQDGRVVGVESLRPPLRLDDLIVILRAVRSENRIGCSIDPDPQRMASLQQYLKTNSTPAPVAVAKGRYQTMANVLGLQSVTIWGLPDDSHAGRVLVEADYRMKLVTIGRLNPAIRGFVSHLAMLRPGGNSMRRWWFTPRYEAIHQSEDSSAFQFVGPRLQLLSQEEYTDAQGNRFDLNRTLASSERYGQQFSERFEELATVIPSFAELQNVTDLIILAALLHRQGLAERVGWRMQLFLDSERVNLAGAPAPKQVQSAFNYKMAGRSMVLGLIGGGVQIQPEVVLRQSLRVSTDRELIAARDNYRASLEGRNLPSESRSADAIRWWWD